MGANAIKRIVRASLISLAAVPSIGEGAAGEVAKSTQRELRPPIVSGAWARATVPGQSVGAAYMKIDSSADITLVKVETAAAKAVEVHAMEHDKGVMRMRALGPLRVKAGAPVVLAPGGTHMMLLGLKSPLKAGDSLRISMTFADSEKRETLVVVQIPVRPLGQ